MTTILYIALFHITDILQLKSRDILSFIQQNQQQKKIYFCQLEIKFFKEICISLINKRQYNIYIIMQL